MTPLVLDVLDPVKGSHISRPRQRRGKIMSAVVASGAGVHGVDLNETLGRESDGQGSLDIFRGFRWENSLIMDSTIRQGSPVLWPVGGGSYPDG